MTTAAQIPLPIGTTVRFDAAGREGRGIIDLDGKIYTTDPAFEGIDPHAVTNVRALAVIDPEDEPTRTRLLSATWHVPLVQFLREIANPTPPLPEEPPIRSLRRAQDGDEWVMTDAGMLMIHGASFRRPIPWADWYERFGPGEAIS
jgi:hypothetical protein